MSDQHAAGTAPFDMPPLSAGFDARGGWLVNRLVAEFSLTDIQAAAPVGVFGGGESGLQAVQEKKPISGRGGFGWAQWTGPRRVQFEKFCADHDRDVTEDEANYLFLVEELRGGEAHALAQLKKCSAIDSAVYTFVTYFERPSDPDTETARSIPWAKRALVAAAKLQAAPKPAPLPAPVSTPNWSVPLEPAPWPRAPQQSTVISTVPPIANAGVAGGLTGFVMMLVKWLVFGLAQKGLTVPEDLQFYTIVGLVFVLGWFFHTRLAKSLKLDAAEK
jgi:hypothetical protein